MNIEEYKEAHSISLEQVAQRIGFSRSFLHLILTHQARISERSANIISLMTHGEISVKELLEYNKYYRGRNANREKKDR